MEAIETDKTIFIKTEIETTDEVQETDSPHALDTLTQDVDNLDKTANEPTNAIEEPCIDNDEISCNESNVDSSNNTEMTLELQIKCEPAECDTMMSENLSIATVCESSVPVEPIPDTDSSWNQIEGQLKQEPNVENPPRTTWRRRRKRVIYENEDPESLKLRKKKRSVELRLKNLQWTLNQPCEVTGKRQKKAPERFELALLTKRKSSLDEAEGNGDPLGSIPWIAQHVRDANIYSLRLLHRVIFRKQGMFSEKHIRKSVLSFKGFPFDESSDELVKRKMPMEKANSSAIEKLCAMLGISKFNKDKQTMIDDILKFLHRPSKKLVEQFLLESFPGVQVKDFPFLPKIQIPNVFMQGALNQNGDEEDNSSSDSSLAYAEDKVIMSSVNINFATWKKPIFFVEGNGIKLKSIKTIVTNIQVASDNFIELLHQLLFLNVDEKRNMRTNILEFSGFTYEQGSTEHISRITLLTRFPLDQIKFICRVLCLPTWHRSRQALIDSIINFLKSPNLNAIKKSQSAITVPLIGPSDFSLKPDVSITEIKTEETEEIEIVPDIHINEDECIEKEEVTEETDPSDEASDVKLKHFPNIHYQIICTPASKLNDLHVILYLRPCPLNNVRKNILDFSHFPFDETSSEYLSRRLLLERMSLQSLRTIVTVLCLTQYVVDLSKKDIVQAVLKFLIKPSALLTSCNVLQTPMIVEQTSLPSPTQSQIPSTSKSLCDIVNESMAQNQKVHFSCPKSSGEIIIQPVRPVNPVITNPRSIAKNPEVNKQKKIQEFLKPHNQSKSFIYNPVVLKSEVHVESEESLAKVKKSVYNVATKVLVESDEDDNEPLSKFIGHPSDDQLRALLAKVIKDSKLEDITMKHVIRTVFNTYPNFDLSYRREFIKSVVRQILSQMDEQRCSVSTTVFTI